MADTEKETQQQEEIVNDLENMVDAMTDDDAEKNPMEQFLFHQRRALEETGKALEALLPDGFKEHSRNASEEFAKGFRILVDTAIDEMKKVSEKEEEEEEELEDDQIDNDDDDDDDESSTGKTKVKVKVD